MTGGSASRSAGILSRANELERLNVQSSGLREQLEQANGPWRRRSGGKGAAYELESAQARSGSGRTRLLKAEAQVEHCRSVAASLKEQREPAQRAGAAPEPHRRDRAGHPARPGPDSGTGGEAAALKSEADGKARGQSDLQTRR